MRRVLVLLATTAMLIGGGCGVKIYEERLTRTLDAMRYQKRLDDQLLPAAKGKLEGLSIYIRPPKGLTGPAKETQLVVEPGKFEDVETFYEADKQNLHILSRVKVNKPPTPKKGAPPPPAPVPRGDFTADVVAILNSYYSVDIDPTKAKPDVKGKNNFKKLVFEAGGKTVQVYIRSIKGDPYEVALVFDYPKAEQASLSSKIELALESMRVGDRARSAFNGSEGEEGEGAEGGAAPGSGGVAF